MVRFFGIQVHCVCPRYRNTLFKISGMFTQTALFGGVDQILPKNVVWDDMPNLLPKVKTCGNGFSTCDW
jgi:hypothetical protein